MKFIAESTRSDAVSRTCVSNSEGAVEAAASKPFDSSMRMTGSTPPSALGAA
jgi:hypothetical protein